MKFRLAQRRLVVLGEFTLKDLFGRDIQSEKGKTGIDTGVRKL